MNMLDYNTNAHLCSYVCSVRAVQSTGSMLSRDNFNILFKLCCDDIQPGAPTGMDKAVLAIPGKDINESVCYTSSEENYP